MELSSNPTPDAKSEKMLHPLEPGSSQKPERSVCLEVIDVDADPKPVERLVSRRRENPKIIVNQDFWCAYLADRAQFKVGEYVLYNNNKFLEKSENPFPVDYKCSGSSVYKTQYTHRVAANDEEFYRHFFASDNSDTLVLSDVLQTQLQEILKQLEANGKFYQIKVEEAFSGKTVTIGDFSKRSYEVYAMDEEYKELEGRYDTLKILEHRVKELELREIASEVKMITVHDTEIMSWKCKKCNSWAKENGSDSRIKNDIYNTADNPICQKCHNSSSPTPRIKVDPASGTIYISSGGRMSFCLDIGYIKFV